MGEIADNLREVRERVARAAKGREVELMVVSKTWPAEVIQEIVDCGHSCFGENRLQEGEEKIPLLASDLRWHFIGGLQRNKVRKVLGLFSEIHSISSLKLAQAVDRIAGELSLKPRIFLEVNIGNEETKGGFLPEALSSHIEEIVAMKHLHCRGLMAIPPRGEDAEDSRPWFVELRNLRDDLETQAKVRLPGLSMGMSNDYEVAIEEGSTIVRVGSAIFGERERKN